jgi:hypothetical protein
MDTEQILFGLRSVIDTMPDLNTGRTDTPEVMTWLGRAAALVEAAGNTVDAVEFAVAMDDVIGESIMHKHIRAVKKVSGILFRAYARVEAKAPRSLQGSYIPAGNPFDALAAISKVFAGAKTGLLIVDPYADEVLLRDFVPLAAENVAIQILSDPHYVKASFQPACGRWRQQYNHRKLDARLTQPRTLHDRLIIVDDKDVWIVTQSFKDLAVRAPASVTHFEPEPAQLKLEAYRTVWQSALPI